MKFNKDWLRDLVYEDTLDSAKVVEDTITGKGRWSIEHRAVFQLTDSSEPDGEFYVVNYRTGATEYQDERAFEYDPYEIECQRVYPTEVIHIEYRPK
jgi:hypothetical protein